MKDLINNKFLGIYYILIGILLSVGPRTIFATCDTSEKVMKCFWSGRAEIGVAILLILIGLLFLILKLRENYFVLSIIGFALAVVAILIPSYLIGGCTNNMMRCRSITFPTIYLISIVTIVVSLISSIFYFRKNKEQSNKGNIGMEY